MFQTVEQENTEIRRRAEAASRQATLNQLQEQKQVKNNNKANPKKQQVKIFKIFEYRHCEYPKKNSYMIYFIPFVVVSGHR